MKRSFIKTIHASTLFALLISCKKDNNSAAVSHNTALLTQQEWKMNKREERVKSSDPFIDYYQSLPACTQDDKYNFKTDNTYELNEGATKCSSSYPQVIATGTWQFTQNETKIKIDTAESNIDKLDDNMLIISGSYYTNPDTNYYRYTFIH